MPFIVELVPFKENEGVQYDGDTALRAEAILPAVQLRDLAFVIELTSFQPTWRQSDLQGVKNVLRLSSHTKPCQAEIYVSLEIFGFSIAHLKYLSTQKEFN